MTVASTVAQDALFSSALLMKRNAVDVESRTTSRKYVSQCSNNIRTDVVGKVIHDIGEEDDLCVGEPDKQDRSSDVVRVKYINLDSIKSVIFTKLESSTSKRQTHILEDSGSAENKEILLFSHDKLSLASILRPLHQVTKEMLV